MRKKQLRFDRFNYIKHIFPPCELYQQDWYIRQNLEEDLDIAMKFLETFRKKYK